MRANVARRGDKAGPTGDLEKGARRSPAAIDFSEREVRVRVRSRVHELRASTPPIS